MLGLDDTSQFPGFQRYSSDKTEVDDSGQNGL